MPTHLEYKLRGEGERGLGRYLASSPELGHVLKQRAEAGARLARFFAPIGVDTPYPGEFRNSIHVEEHRARNRKYRVLMQGYWVVADSRDAIWAEFGRRRGYRPYRGANALGRMARALSTPRRGRKA